MLVRWRGRSQGQRPAAARPGGELFLQPEVFRQAVNRVYQRSVGQQPHQDHLSADRHRGAQQGLGRAGR